MGIAHYYEGNCGVENEGVKHLVKGCWPNLQTLYLCTKNISAGQNLIEFDGHRAISEANWSKMGLLFIYQYLLKAGCATKPIYIFALINCQINIKSIQIKKSRHRQFENDFKAILKRMHKSMLFLS